MEWAPHTQSLTFLKMLRLPGKGTAFPRWICVWGEVSEAGTEPVPVQCEPVRTTCWSFQGKSPKFILVLPITCSTHNFSSSQSHLLHITFST